MWTHACKEAFKKLKAIVSSELVLCFPNFELHFEVYIDASDKAISGLLVQEKHPVAYENRKLNEEE